MAILFQLEKSRTKSETQQALVVLKEWLTGAPPSLIRAFRTWFRRVKLPRHLPDVVLPELTDLQEIETMLEVKVDDWLEQSKEDGRKEGRVEGRKEGKQEGEALMLIRLLETKFGALEAQTRAILFELDTQTLLECAERLLTAQTVQEVIGR